MLRHTLSVLLATTVLGSVACDKKADEAKGDLAEVKSEVQAEAAEAKKELQEGAEAAKEAVQDGAAAAKEEVKEAVDGDDEGGW